MVLTGAAGRRISWRGGEGSTRDGRSRVRERLGRIGPSQEEGHGRDGEGEQRHRSNRGLAWNSEGQELVPGREPVSAENSLAVPRRNPNALCSRLHTVGVGLVVAKASEQSSRYPPFPHEAGQI